MNSAFIELPRDYNHTKRCQDAWEDELIRLQHASIDVDPLNHLWSYRMPGLTNPRTGSDIFNVNDAKLLREEKRGRVVSVSGESTITLTQTGGTIVTDDIPEDGGS